MKREKGLKVLDYAAAFFLLMCIAMSASRWMQGSDFYPLWLIVLFFGLFLTLIIWRRKFEKKASPPPAPPDSTPEEKEAARQAREKQWKEDSQLEKEAHNLILKMCESKNIRLAIKQPGRNGGHYEIPEIWTMEKAVPLTPDELYAITANRVLHVVTELHDDVIYARGFSRNGGWVSYELAEVGEQ